MSDFHTHQLNFKQLKQPQNIYMGCRSKNNGVLDFSGLPLQRFLK